MSRLPGTPFSGCGTLGQSLAASELTFPSAQWMGGWERYKADHVGFWDKESDGGPLPLAQEKHAHAQVRACRSLQTAPPSLTPACVGSGAPPASHLRAFGQEPPRPHTCVHWVRSRCWSPAVQFKSWFCHLVAVCPWTSHLTSLCPHSPKGKKEI